MPIYSCKSCVPPTRYPGCHSKCPNYLEEKAKHDALKAEHDRKQAIDHGIRCQREAKVYQALRNSRKKG